MKRNWQDLLELALGAWIIASPFVLGFITLGNPSATAILIGSLVVGLAVVAISMPSYWEEWTTFGLGLALLASPWIVGYAAVMIATTNAVVSGALLIGLAIIGLIKEREFHRHTHTPHAGVHG